jgi:hypothetical protein
MIDTIDTAEFKSASKEVSMVSGGIDTIDTRDRHQGQVCGPNSTAAAVERPHCSTAWPEDVGESPPCERRPAGRAPGGRVPGRLAGHQAHEVLSVCTRQVHWLSLAIHDARVDRGAPADLGPSPRPRVLPTAVGDVDHGSQYEKLIWRRGGRIREPVTLTA